MMVKSYRRKPGEEYMSPRMQEYFRQMLITWQKELIQSANHYKQYLHDNHTTYADEVDQASQEFFERVELKSRDRERKLIAKIRYTLEDIMSGDYGFCTDCGNEIGVKRLEARPTATRCIECKTVSESMEKRVGKYVPKEELELV